MERFDGVVRWLPPEPRGPREDLPTTLDSPLTIQWLNVLRESTLVGSGLLDRAGRVIDANHLAVEGCRFDRADVIGRPFWECGWWRPEPLLAARVREWFETAIATGQSLSAVTRYFLGDGSRAMVELGLVPILDWRSGDDGPEVQYLVATAVDMSELLSLQAKREDRLAEEALAMRMAEQRMRDGLDAMIDHVTIAHSVRDDLGAIVDFEIDFANLTSADGAGRSAGDLVGRRVCDLYPAWRTSGMFEIFQHVVETGAPFVRERLRYEDALPDGTAISGYWDLRVSKLDDGYIAASRDVTAAVSTEQTARESEAAAGRERMAMEILQQAALNVDLPEVPGISIGVHYQPAVAEVPLGGDWYDVVVLGNGRIVLIIADVAGHGPSTAGHMVQLRNILRAIAVEEGEPAELLRRANEVVVTLSRPAEWSFATCCVATLDTTTGELRWALAGHPPPVLHTASVAGRFLSVAPGLPLGVAAPTRYETGSVTLDAGDRLVLYTDGLIEQRGVSLDVGFARLLEGVRRADEHDAASAAVWLASSISARDDDVAVIVVDLDG